MPVEFSCNNCQKLLRVPDDAAGKHAQCPSCGAVQEVPGRGSGDPLGPPGESPSPWLFGESALSGSPPPGKPYGEEDAINPYAAPAPFTVAPKPAAPFDGPITNRQPSLEDILKHGWQVWQENLGLLAGVTLVAAAISCGVAAPFGILQGEMEDHGDPGGAAVLSLTGNIISNLVQLFFGIGLAQISLSLARGGRAEFVDLFRGGSRFMPVLGISILTGLAVSFGLLACIVPGIILALMFWPTYYLVLEEKAGIIESFSVARHVTEGNFATAIALWLLSVGVTILGFLMLCIGILFAAPLVSLFWATAYLMMSGQLAPGAERPATGYGV